MLPLAGYADRLSVRPGETLRFHTANGTGVPVTAKVVRVICADPNPAGLGVKVEDVDAARVAALDAPKREPLQRGSFGMIATPQLADLSSITVIANVFMSGRETRSGAIVSVVDPGPTKEDPTHGGIQLAIHYGRLVCWIGNIQIEADGPAVWHRQIETHTQLAQSIWHRVWASFNHRSGKLTLGVQQLDNGRAVGEPWIHQSNIDDPAKAGGPQVLIGASLSEAHDLSRFNGRIERPMIFDRVLSVAEIERAARGETVPGLVAAWDFSKEMHTDRIVDTGPHGLHGALINAPTRAVRGSNWTGREQCFRHAPEQYGAIHFHEDDIDDCRWPVTHEYTVPADLKSGAYALMLQAGDTKENIPFFVVPPKGKQTAKLAVLVSTFTYTVYGNHARPEWTTNPAWKDAWIKQAKEWNAYPHNPGDHREYGLSTYNFHTDGSGIAMASWARPMLNLRIGYITYPYPDIRGSGLRHYPADSHLLAWLEHNGIAYDLITDWELHHEGAELLKPYTCVTTGSHPEYHTTEMLDALEAYRDGGGRFMYLGGNGFYWKIALSPDKPGLIEIRRAEGGIRAWAAEPGEYYNQFDGEYGGLWRRNARPPQLLCGVGFTAQGNFVGSHYRIKTDARSNPRTAWMFDGVNDEIIGNFGLSGHGAAGFELDRADTKLGTPAHAQVVAQSEDHPPEAPWVLVPEEQLTHLTTFPGESHKQLIRADMTLFETPNNGCVFSTGSITFCGSLPHNNFDNNVSKLLHNVLTRFLDPVSKFPVPYAAQ